MIDNATIVVLVGAVGAMWKLSRDNTQALKVLAIKHDMDKADRADTAAALKLEREHEAAIVKMQLQATAATLAERVTDTAKDVRVRLDANADRIETSVATAKTDAVDKLDAQTAVLTGAIDSAKTEAANAYTEANSVNLKIEALQEAHKAQGIVLADLLARMTPATDAK